MRSLFDCFRFVLVSQYNKGLRLAFRRGYARAIARLNPTITLKHAPVKTDVMALAEEVFPPSKLHFSDEAIKNIHTDLLTKSKKTPHVPTDAQKQLILSDARNNLVIAGAGSGKSTTLILRVLALHKYHGVPLSRITVFSFTTASCEDFRAKMISVFAKHDIVITIKMAKSVVRTFHSKVLEFSRGSITSRHTPFEFLKEEKEKTIGPDDISVLTKLKNVQAQLLRNAYQELYKLNEPFRALMDQLDEQAFLYRKSNSTVDDLAEQFAGHIVKRDSDFTRQMHELIVPEDMDTYQPISIDFNHPASGEMYANRYIAALDLYVVYIPDTKYCALKGWARIRAEGDKRISIDLAGANKMSFLLHNSDKSIYFVRNNEDIHRLRERVASAKTPSPSNSAPIFQYRTEGEFDNRSVYEVFYHCASFFDSMGVTIGGKKPFPAVFTKNLNRPDTTFISALQIFWPWFLTYAGREGVVLFSSFFKDFSDPSADAFKRVCISKLKSMEYTLIDEYQDISPLEFQWIKATLLYIRDNVHDVETSIVCVGDDFQSIYGWKGSSPQFIMKHQQYYPGPMTTIVMEENFRSFGNIVQPAETVLSRISPRNKTDKTGICFRGDGVNPINLKPYNEDAIKNHLTSLEDLFVRDHVQGYNTSSSIFCLVLSRSNVTINLFQKWFFVDRRPSAKFCSDLGITQARYKRIRTFAFRFETFHRSKGLEATNTVLLEDCMYDNINPIKNMVYLLAGIRDDTYDSTQKEEACRLAYVALTRAMDRVYWFADPKKGGAFDIVKDTTALTADQPRVETCSEF